MFGFPRNPAAKCRIRGLVVPEFFEELSEESIRDLVENKKVLGETGSLASFRLIIGVSIAVIECASGENQDTRSCWIVSLCWTPVRSAKFQNVNFVYSSEIKQAEKDLLKIGNKTEVRHVLEIKDEPERTWITAETLVIGVFHSSGLCDDTVGVISINRQVVTYSQLVHGLGARRLIARDGITT